MVQPNLHRLRAKVRREGGVATQAPSRRTERLGARVSREQVLEILLNPHSYGWLGALVVFFMATENVGSRLVAALFGYGFGLASGAIGLWLLNALVEVIRRIPLLWAAIGLVLIWAALPHP